LCRGVESAELERKKPWPAEECAFGEKAVGAINEKIEGFFDICEPRGLRGNQGVVIPASNVSDLMLRTDLIEAVTAGRFRVYPVETIDQCTELLTGLPAGERDEEGNFPEGSFNRKSATD